MTFQLNRKDRRIVIKIVAIYSLFGSLWIYLSDWVLGLLVRDPDIITRIATYKGLMFILVTAALLYYLIGRYIYRLSESRRQIAASEDDLRSLLELMPVGVAWADDNGAVLYVNRNFIERFGYTLGEVPTVEDWYLKAYPDPAYRRDVVSLWNTHIAEYHAHGTPVPPRDVRVTCRDGSVRRIIINTRMSLNRILVIFTDITERENQQEELIKKQKLESIGVLAGGIAHDFNNILTAIMGNISYAGMLLDPGHKAEMPLHQANSAVKRAAELAHQLLTFSKGGQPVTAACDSRQLVQESLSLVLRGANVQSRIEFPDDVFNIRADAGQISQVFNNLIINAVQAMPDGGTITVRASDAPVTGNDNPYGLPAGRYVRFLFIDEGCGIPEDIRHNIFDPYFTTKSGGSGLGLASVQSIVTKHGGHIGVHPTTGTGTTFEVLLPACDDALAGSSSAVAGAVSDVSEIETGASLLVMDDEEMIRDMAVAMLEELGYRVTACGDGDAAVSLYKTAQEDGAPFSAVIMDLTIPGGMGGREAARAILDADPQARLIVSSGYSGDPVISDYRRYGFCAAVLKPYGVADIAAVLEDTLLRYKGNMPE